MERLREVAFLTIGRAVGFGGLAVLCVMAGTAFDPLLAVQAGGFGALIILAVLLIKARLALTADHRKTEMWLHLKKDERPAESYAQWAASTVLRDTYLQFARWMAFLAVIMWTLAVLMPLFGIAYVDPYTV